MIRNTDIEWTAMTDDAIISQIGLFIKKNRIAKNKTQKQLVTAAGMNRGTLSQIENGESITLTMLIQILRALGALYVLDEFNVVNQISPIEAVKLKKKERKRASGRLTNKQKNKSDW